MARPAVQGLPVDFSAGSATTVTSGTVSGLQAGDMLLLFVGMRSASAISVSSVADTIAASGDLAWDHASDNDGGVSNNRRDAQNVQQTELWRAVVQSGDNASGDVTVNVSASTTTLYCRLVVIRATAGGALSIDQQESSDQGAADTDPGTLSITPTVDSLVVAFAGNRQDTFVDFDGTLTAIGSSQVAGAGGDQMRWHAGYVDGTASTPQTCTFDYSAVGEWILQAVSVEEAATGPTPIAGSDTATSTEAGTVSATAPGSESSTGTDTGTASVTAAGADTSSGADQGTVSASASGADTASGSETSQATVTATGADSAAAIDAGTVVDLAATPVSGADSGTGSESGVVVDLTPPAPPPSTGPTGGRWSAHTDADEAAIYGDFAAKTGSDRGEAMESAWVADLTVTPPVERQGADNATAVESAAVAGTVASIDSAVGTEDGHIRRWVDVQAVELLERRVREIDEAEEERIVLTLLGMGDFLP